MAAEGCRAGTTPQNISPEAAGCSPRPRQLRCYQREHTAAGSDRAKGRITPKPPGHYNAKITPPQALSQARAVPQACCSVPEGLHTILLQNDVLTIDIMAHAM